MKKSRDHDFEEIAEIPERVSESKEIEHGTNQKSDGADEHADSRQYDEITMTTYDLNDRKEIIDDYRDSFNDDEDKTVATQKEDHSNVNDDVAIEFNHTISQKLPSDFNVSEIGNIDLSEAEEIANEDILFLTEDDLIEGLEDFDLIPLEEEHKTERSGPGKREYRRDEEAEVAQESVQESASYVDDIVEEPVEINEQQSDFGGHPGENEQDITGKSEKEHEDFVVPSLQEDNGTEHFIELDSQFEAGDGIDKAEAGPSVGDDNVNVFSHDFEAEHIQIDDYVKGYMKKRPEGREINFRDVTIEPVKEFEKESIPQQFHTINDIDDRVNFADDQYVIKKDSVSETVFEDNELARITSDILEVVEGNAIILPEADIDEDKELIAHVFTGITPVFEDLLLEFEDEFKYIDDEMDFIHSVITEEDYSDYIKYIDDYHGIKLKKGVTTAVELMGLTPSEIDLVEDKLFSEEYKDVNLYAVFDFFKTDYSDTERASLIEKDCTYILPSNESLTEDEKSSIETDLSSESALIFEEDVDEIRDLFIKAVGTEKAEKIKVIDEVIDITDKVVIIEDEIDIDRFIMEFPDNKQADIRKLLSYLDGLFEKLPRDTLRKFVDSEYFDLYIKVLTEMGVKDGTT